MKDRLVGLDLSGVDPQRDYKNACRDKVRHPSLEAAEVEAGRLSHILGKEMQAYRCRYCRYYHTGTSWQARLAEIRSKSKKGTDEDTSTVP